MRLATMLFSPTRHLVMICASNTGINALSQGKLAGRNMAGAHEAFTYQPYFFSDLFEFGYEATGEVDTSLETFATGRRKIIPA